MKRIYLPYTVGVITMRCPGSLISLGVQQGSFLDPRKSYDILIDTLYTDDTLLIFKIYFFQFHVRDKDRAN